MTDCKGIIGRWWGHKGQAQYSTSRYEQSDEHMSTKNHSRTYAGTVCLRCGARLDEARNVRASVDIDRSPKVRGLVA